MQIEVLAFAHLREQLGFSARMVECSEDQTPRDILGMIAPNILLDKSIRVAVNREYGDWDKPVGRAFEIAIIPPVSGG
jgi:molybdopterin converting factor small subunit